MSKEKRITTREDTMRQSTNSPSLDQNYTTLTSTFICNSSSTVFNYHRHSLYEMNSIVHPSRWPRRWREKGKNEIGERRGESNKAILEESKAETLDLRVGPAQR
jgi:hypothetical protein